MGIFEGIWLWEVVLKNHPFSGAYRMLPYGLCESHVYRSTLFHLKVDNKKSLITKTSSTASGPPSRCGSVTPRL